MLKFDFKSISDFEMQLDDKCITTDTPTGRTVYQVEDWKRAYGDFFVEIANCLTDRDDWSFAYDFYRTQAEESLSKSDSVYDALCCGEMPLLKNCEASNQKILEDFEDIKQNAYRLVYEKAAKKSGKIPKRTTYVKNYDEIVDEIAFLAMQKVWYLYKIKQFTLEEARDESVAIFREYRRLRLVLTGLEKFQKENLKTYKDALEMRKRTTGTFLNLLNSIDNLSEVDIINELIEIICLQNGENVSGKVLKEKLSEKRIRELEEMGELLRRSGDIDSEKRKNSEKLVS